MLRNRFLLVLGSVAILALALLAFAGQPPMTGAQVEVTATNVAETPNPTACCPATGFPQVTPNPTGIVLTTQPGVTTAPVFTLVPMNTTMITVGTPTPELANPRSDVDVDGDVDVVDVQMVARDWHKPVPTPTPTPRPVVNGDLTIPLVGKPELYVGARNADFDFLVHISDEIPGLAQEDSHSYDLRGDRSDWFGGTLELPTTVITPTKRYVRILAGSSILGGQLDVSCTMTTPEDQCEVRFAFTPGSAVIMSNMHTTTDDEKRLYPLKSGD